mgnify:CR=1 FL=1
MHGEAPGRLWKTSRSDQAYGSQKGSRLGVNYGLMLTSGAKTKVTTRFLVKNYPYDMFGRYSRYKAVT